jgi:hypothetical protein
VTGGVRAYARHRGVGHASIQRAIARGRIPITRRAGRIVIDFAEADRAWEENRARLPPASMEPLAAAASDVSIPLGHFSCFRLNGQLALAVSEPGHEAAAVVLPLEDLTAIDIAIALLRETTPAWVECLAANFGRRDDSHDNE